MIDEYAHGVYRVTKKFPKNEIHGITSQLRRSSLSVALNYIEGYARQGDKVYKNFLKTSYGSLKESMHVLGFAQKEGFLSPVEFDILHNKGHEIGKMLWGVIQKL